MKKTRYHRLALSLTLLLVIFSFPSLSKQEMNNSTTDITKIKNTLGAFHQAAANADTQKYFALLSKEAVFIGTDATERWTKAQFKAFVQPYFSRGQGWLYTPKQQNISFINAGNTAFFDEILHSESYGTCRGTGVLIKEDGHWKIAQYSLSIPIPNALAKDFVKTIKKSAQKLDSLNNRENK